MKVFREDRDARNKRTRDWHRDNPQKSYWLAAKKRAKFLAVPFHIEPEDIIFPEYCSVLDIPINLVKTDGPRIRNNNTPSLDRIVPELGYVKGNIKIISWRANRLKNDATLEESRRIYKYLEKSRKDVWSKLDVNGDFII